ncbi:MAG: hypothetical protein AAF281_10240 [Pseudomonadota bacterium]
MRGTAAGERAGWRPSLIFSPMLVETGQPLLISNLDMAETIDAAENDETVAFFEWFPAARKTFKIKTAVRMNASFPYVSPSTALPTEPYLRVVDAGYYDNYGIDAAVAYLSREPIQKWLLENCSGVGLLEIRAFPSPGLPEAGPKPWSRALQWLTTPMQAIFAARSSTMTFRNRQSFGRQRQIFGALSRDPDFLRQFRFEVNSQTSLSWYMPKEELDEMRTVLESHEISSRLAELRHWWQAPPPAP